MNNQVGISACLSQLQVVHNMLQFETSSVTNKMHMPKNKFWLSLSQPQYFFKLSSTYFGCPGQIDNQNFKGFSSPFSTMINVIASYLFFHPLDLTLIASVQRTTRRETSLPSNHLALQENVSAPATVLPM